MLLEGLGKLKRISLPLVFSVFCAEKTSGSEIAMCDRMQMYNIMKRI
jgi:hypothetical protein